ncbi:hypothetical protein D3C72_1711310 [compost metagenome]
MFRHHFTDIRHFFQSLDVSRKQLLQRAKMRGQIGGRGFTDLTDAQRIQETGEGGLLGLLQRVDQILR